ncbi:MAG: hypothetical protein HZB56_00490 [Deltaproteobacteria bacterium]|nr:hypothetical protein [Deltaproteobacteria bacterium]
MSAGPGKRPLLAFRPASVVQRLRPRSEACVLSLRDLLPPLRAAGRPVPLLSAPLPALMRAALLACKEARSALGLGLPAGLAPEPWFAAAAAAAEELAPRLPVFLSASIAVAPGGVEAAVAHAYRLVEAGLTHLAVAVDRIPVAERARAAAQVAAQAAERELAVECLVPGGGEGLDADVATAFLEELQGWGLEPDLLGVRCEAPAGVEEARAQARALAAVARALGPTPLLRRGPAGRLLLPVLRPAGVAVVEDGEAVLQAGLPALPPAEREAALQRGAPGERLRAPPAGGEGGEGLFYGEAAALVEALGASGTADLVVEALAGPERRP